MIQSIMFLLSPKFLSLQSLQPIRFYKKLDGWLLGSGKPIRIKLKKRELWIKHTSKSKWIINPVVYTTDHWRLLCIFCGCVTDVLYYGQDYRCRRCTKYLHPTQKIDGMITAQRQASVGDYSMLQSTGTKKIAMRIHLESTGVVNKLLSPVTEQEAIQQIRYEKIAEDTPILDPIKQGRLIWVSHRYIWVDGQT